MSLQLKFSCYNVFGVWETAKAVLKTRREFSNKVFPSSFEIILKRRQEMEFFFYFLNAPGVNAVTLILAVVIVTLKKCLVDKLKNGVIKAIFPFTAGIILYLAYGLIFLYKSELFSIKSILLSGVACGTVSSAIATFITRLKNGTANKVDLKKDAVTLLLTDFGVKNEDVEKILTKLFPSTASALSNNTFDSVLKVLQEHIPETTQEELKILALFILSVISPEKNE